MVWSAAGSSSCPDNERTGSGTDSQARQAYVSSLLDLTAPSLWYPLARTIKRKVVAHLGPTNSGKTYQALQALKAANSGVYCGPLRLLACEVADRLAAGGVACSLVTGQEVRAAQGAGHTSCTVEMADVGRMVDVAVIDEIQMIGDRARGWAWTRALLGLPAHELHLAGDPASLPLVERLVGECGDELEVRRYKRLSPLVVSAHALGRVAAAQPGDCLVAFSRRSVHGLKRQVMKQGGHEACVVYGALPPDARRQQAALFNDAEAAPGGSQRVLVASDAIGMGLNLNIGRVVFTSLTKFDGRAVRPLTPSEVKQIAGRAGRYGGAHPTGHVTCLNAQDLPLLHHAMATRSEPLTQACLLPRSEDLAIYTAHHPERPLATSMAAFASEALLAPHYCYGQYEAQYRIASALRYLGSELRPEELITFTTAPADMDDQVVAAALLCMVQRYCVYGEVTPDVITHAPLKMPESEAELKRLEEVHRVHDLYMWLCYRLPHAFHGREQVEANRSLCSELIEAGLDRLAAAFHRHRKHHHQHQQHQEQQHQEQEHSHPECQHISSVADGSVQPKGAGGGVGVAGSLSTGLDASPEAPAGAGLHGGQMHSDEGSQSEWECRQGRTFEASRSGRGSSGTWGHAPAVWWHPCGASEAYAADDDEEEEEEEEQQPWKRRRLGRRRRQRGRRRLARA